MLFRFYSPKFLILVKFLILSSSFSASSSADKLNSIGEQFSIALKYADAKMWDRAHAEAKKISSPSAESLITWLRLRDGAGSFAEYELFLDENNDWPGIKLLRVKGESSINSKIEHERLEDYFFKIPPQTGFGALKMAESFLKVGNLEKAKQIITKSWLSHSYKQDQFKKIQKLFGEYLVDYNDERIENCLWEKRTNDAKQMLHLVSPENRELVRVRIALQNRKAGVDQMIRALPKKFQNNGGLTFDRLIFRRKNNLFDRAEDLLAKSSMDHSALGRPEQWLESRQIYSRRALRSGKITRAYVIASNHFVNHENLYDKSRLADLEWLSGFIALEFQKSPQKALKHFLYFSELADNPIAESRAGYWLGKTYEELENNEQAKEFFAIAAKFQTSFYGQLAAERGGVPINSSLFKPREIHEWTDANFLKKSTLQAALLLFYANRSVLADRFFNHLSEELSLQEKLQLSQLSADIGLPAAGLSIARTAASSGSILPEFYFPISNEALKIDLENPSLTNAIIRQESEFFKSSISEVGALGLMQIMPATAQQMAKRLKLVYDMKRLTNDAEYNVALGSEFLSLMLKKHGGSKVLALAAYNAGPYKVKQWVKEIGDPREGDIDTVVWIELIPYSETRNYVMRVLEADWVYRGILGDGMKKLFQGSRRYHHEF